MQTASFFTYRGQGRICIARWAPRRIPRGYAHFPALAPPRAWNGLDHVSFARRYLEQLDAFDPGSLWDELHTLAGSAEPVLQCWETPDQIRDRVPHKDACHRHIVAAWFEARLGVRVPEVDAEAESFLSPDVHCLILEGRGHALS
jgi:hypothetical protein